MYHPVTGALGKKLLTAGHRTRSPIKADKRPTNNLVKCQCIFHLKTSKQFSISSVHCTCMYVHAIQDLAVRVHKVWGQVHILEKGLNATKRVCMVYMLMYQCTQIVFFGGGG